jgi:hypothetical protein
MFGLLKKCDFCRKRGARYVPKRMLNSPFGSVLYRIWRCKHCGAEDMTKPDIHGKSCSAEYATSQLIWKDINIEYGYWK